MKQTLPFSLIRGGTSKGVFFNAADLPADEAERERIIIASMEGVGPGDVKQIDGLGGADSLTAKAAVVGISEENGIDLEFKFYQVLIGKGKVSDSQNCGNILSGILPYAIQDGMVETDNGKTTKVIKMLNSASLCEVTVETPGGKVNTEGNAKVDGVPGTAAPIICNYLGLAGNNCGALLPTGNICDTIEGIQVTCVDNGMPVVILRASDLGITGYESKLELDANEELKARIEKIRLELGPKMNLGDVSLKTVPKMTIVSKPQHGGLINTRTFIPHVCHTAVGVLGAVSAATGCILPGSVAEDLVSFNNDLSGNHQLEVEHPSGSFTVNLEIENDQGELTFPKSGVVRTARIIARGEVFIP